MNLPGGNELMPVPHVKTTPRGFISDVYDITGVDF